MKATWLVLGLVIGAGCGGDDDAASLPRAELSTEASYGLVTTVDVTATAVLPETAVEYLDMLRRLRDDPGEAFFDILDEAGVPLVDELRAALPDAVEDKVGEWMSDAVTARFRDEIDLLLGAADTALAHFDIVSDLDLPAIDAKGRARATHKVTGLRFGTFMLAVPEVATVTSVGVDAQLARGKDGADAELALGPHTFGLAYGERIYEMLEQMAMMKHPDGLRGLLGEKIDCPAIAASVAAKCVFSVCVGHAEQLTALCERGLDEALARLEEKLASLRIDAISLDAGAGKMWDDGRDDVIDRVSGKWTARINFGQGLRAAPATFSGTARR